MGDGVLPTAQQTTVLYDEHIVCKIDQIQMKE